MAVLCAAFDGSSGGESKVSSHLFILIKAKSQIKFTILHVDEPVGCSVQFDKGEHEDEKEDWRSTLIAGYYYN